MSGDIISLYTRKGLIGDDNSRLLGSLIVLKHRLAALSREDIPESERVPHPLYVEEAQSFIGGLESILKETRKYRLPLTIATQGIESLPPDDASAVLGNCATVVSFRVSAPDALRIAQEFRSEILGSQIQDLPDYTFYVGTLTRKSDAAGASPSGPHRVDGYPPLQRHRHHAHRESVIRVSQARFAKPRSIVNETLNRDFFTDVTLPEKTSR